MKFNIALIPCLVLLTASLQTNAGPYTALKNKACPDAWAINGTAIPVIRHIPRANDRSPWGVLPSNDQFLGESHLSSSGALVTIDLYPTDSDSIGSGPRLPADLLTVASECLEFRNGEVDTWNYVAPPAAIPSSDNGWIPAVVFD